MQENEQAQEQAQEGEQAGNAATGVVFPIFIIAQTFAWWIGDGCAAYLNISQGKNNTSKAHKCIGAVWR